MSDDPLRRKTRDLAGQLARPTISGPPPRPPLPAAPPDEPTSPVDDEPASADTDLAPTWDQPASPTAAEESPPSSTPEDSPAVEATPPVKTSSRARRPKRPDEVPLAPATPMTVTLTSRAGELLERLAATDQRPGTWCSERCRQRPGSCVDAIRRSSIPRARSPSRGSSRVANSTTTASRCH